MTMKKFGSLLLALAMCLSLSVSAFAAGAEPEVRTRTYELNGATITVTIGPAEKILTRSSLVFEGDATSSTSPIPFNFDELEGTFGEVRVWNDAKDDTEMSVKFAITIINHAGERKTMSSSDQIAGNERAYVQVRSNDGYGLRGGISTTLRPVGGSSVPFTYTASQE